MSLASAEVYLGSRLQANGFRYEGQTTGIAVDLLEINDLRDAQRDRETVRNGPVT